MLQAAKRIQSGHINNLQSVHINQEVNRHEEHFRLSYKIVYNKYIQLQCKVYVHMDALVMASVTGRWKQRDSLSPRPPQAVWNISERWTLQVVLFTCVSKWDVLPATPSCIP